MQKKRKKKAAVDPVSATDDSVCSGQVEDPHYLRSNSRAEV